MGKLIFNGPAPGSRYGKILSPGFFNKKLAFSFMDEISKFVEGTLIDPRKKKMLSMKFDNYSMIKRIRSRFLLSIKFISTNFSNCNDVFLFYLSFAFVGNINGSNSCFGHRTLDDSLMNTRGNCYTCSICALTSDNSEVRRVDYYRENQRSRIRSISKISGRVPKDFQDRKTGEMSQAPLISSFNRMPENKSRNLVILEVGTPGDTWRYSIERERFAEKSEWFRAMLLGDLAPPPSDPPPTVPLHYVDKRAFDHLLTFLRGDSLHFHSVSTARSTLDVAHQLICPELVRLAVDYIIANLTTSTVLSVYHGLNLYVPDKVLLSDERAIGTPSAPPALEDEVDEIGIACWRLLSACHTIINTSPEDVLRQEHFEELSACEVAEIASRDDLGIVKEGCLFSALDKWAASECRRRGLEPAPYNKRTVLDDDVWYSVRYLLMTSSEFIEGPMRSGILSPDESAYIAARILGHNVERTNEQIRNFFTPNRLSTRPRNRTRNNIPRKNSSMKLGKKEREDNKRNRRKECASQGQKTCARIGDCIVRVLACVFE